MTNVAIAAITIERPSATPNRRNSTVRMIERRQQEAEPVRRDDVEDDRADDADEAGDMPRRLHPRFESDPRHRRAIAPAAHDQEQTADDQPDRDQRGKKCGADALRRDRRIRRNDRDDGRAQRKQQQTENGVAELHEERGNAVFNSELQRERYLTMPTAFIVAPRSALDFAIHFANSSGPA